MLQLGIICPLDSRCSSSLHMAPKGDHVVITALLKPVHVGNIIFFPEPLVRDYFQWKFLAINDFFFSIKRSPDNQINTSFIDISRIK